MLLPLDAVQNRGMGFACDRCGACCRTFPVFASAADAEREPRLVVFGKRLEPWLETEQWRYQLHPLPFLEGCAFLNGQNLCSIYETRPSVCRSFDAGSAQCTEARRRIGLPPLLPALVLD